MCGILGFVTDKPSETNADNFCALLDLLQSRGGDATGVAIVKKTGIRIVKQPVDATKFLDKNWGALAKDIAEAHIVIGHTRKWTQGKPDDNNNNHPISSKHWVMVHNGCCSQMDRIKGYKYAGEVDSEILLSHIEESDIIKGYAKLGWGSGAIALLPKKETNKLILVRHNEPTSIALNSDRDTVFFASTDTALKNGLADIFDIFSTFQIRDTTEHIIYEVTHSPIHIEMVGEVEVKREYNSSSKSGYGGSYGGGCYHRDKEGYWNGHEWVKYGNDKNTKAYDEELNKLSWSKDTFSWLSTKMMDKKEKVEPSALDQYMFDGYSVDFSNWTKIELADKSCWVDNSREFVKMANRDKKCHFIMRVDDALRCGLLEMKL